METEQVFKEKVLNTLAKAEEEGRKGYSITRLSNLVNYNRVAVKNALMELKGEGKVDYYEEGPAKIFFLTRKT